MNTWTLAEIVIEHGDSYTLLLEHSEQSLRTWEKDWWNRTSENELKLFRPQHC